MKVFWTGRERSQRGRISAILAQLIQRPLDVADHGRGQILLHGFVKDGVGNQDAEDPLSLGPETGEEDRNEFLK